MRVRKAVAPEVAAAQAGALFGDESDAAPPHETAPKRSLQEQADADQAAHHDEMERQAIAKMDTAGMEMEREASARSEDGGWRTVIDSIVTLPVSETYDRLTRDLIVEDASTYGIVHAALNRADSNYHKAALLARGAKLEQQQVDRQIDGRLEILRTAARKEIEAEKLAANPKLSNRATLEEVKDRCQSSWPDEVRSLERRRDEAHGARAACEELATAWRSRAQSLRELVQGVRGAP